MFDLNKIVQDLISKGLQYVGAVITGSGVATADQAQILMGAFAAIIGVAINILTNKWTRKDIAIVATANDKGTTTAAVVAKEVALKPVGGTK